MVRNDEGGVQREANGRMRRSEGGNAEKSASFRCNIVKGSLKVGQVSSFVTQFETLRSRAPLVGVYSEEKRSLAASFQCQCQIDVAKNGAPLKHRPHTRVLRSCFSGHVASLDDSVEQHVGRGISVDAPNLLCKWMPRTVPPGRESSSETARLAAENLTAFHCTEPRRSSTLLNELLRHCLRLLWASPGTAVPEPGRVHRRCSHRRKTSIMAKLPNFLYALRRRFEGVNYTREFASEWDLRDGPVQRLLPRSPLMEPARLVRVVVHLCIKNLQSPNSLGSLR